MKRRPILSAIVFCLSFGTSVASAQSSPEDAARLFDLAAAKHKRELRNLFQTRSAPSIHLPDASSKSIAKVLAAGSQERQRGYRERSDQITYPDRTAVLFYSYDEGHLHSWLIDALGIQAYHKQQISKQQISDAILNQRRLLHIDSLQSARMVRQRSDLHVVPVTPQSEPRQTEDSSDEESIDRAITDLTQILLPSPVANQLDGVKHLIIVPILEMGSVPYAILKPFKDNTVLLERMSLSIAPSLFDLGQSLPSMDIHDLFDAPLIAGNPYLPETSKWSVPPLPGAEQEAQAVATLMNAVPLLGKQATKAEIVSRAETASLLYFATHGVSNDRNPLSESFLMLSADRFEQGWWTAKEIQQTRLRAKMAILSACQTGLGQSHDAGIIGLARAFQIAGVPRVVMSLWNVDDQVTSQLMQAFMKHLKTQLPSEALRQAMLEVRQHNPHPSKWASFVLFGTPR